MSNKSRKLGKHVSVDPKTGQVRVVLVLEWVEWMTFGRWCLGAPEEMSGRHLERWVVEMLAMQPPVEAIRQRVMAPILLRSRYRRPANSPVWIRPTGEVPTLTGDPVCEDCRGPGAKVHVTSWGVPWPQRRCDTCQGRFVVRMSVLMRKGPNQGVRRKETEEAFGSIGGKEASGGADET